MLNVVFNWVFNIAITLSIYGVGICLWLYLKRKSSTSSSLDSFSSFIFVAVFFISTITFYVFDRGSTSVNTTRSAPVSGNQVYQPNQNNVSPRSGFLTPTTPSVPVYNQPTDIPDISNLIQSQLRIQPFTSESTKSHLGITSKSLNLKSENIASIIEKVADLDMQFGRLVVQNERILLSKRFNREGDLLEEDIFNSNGDLLQKNTFNYDKDNRIFESDVHGSQNDLWGRNIFKYNEDGNLIEKSTYDSDGDLFQLTKYFYDEQNNQTETLNYNSQGNLEKSVTFNYNNDIYTEGSTYNSIGNLIVKEVYDFKGNLSETIKADGVFYSQLDEYGRFTGYIKYQYDDENNLTKASVYRLGGILIGYLENLYDEQGNLIEISTMYTQNGSKSTRKNKYDENNNKVESLLYSSSNILDEQEECEYEYDDNANWIERICVTYSDKFGERQIDYDLSDKEKTIRIINYFE